MGRKTIDFRSFKQAIQTAPLVTLYDSQVRYAVKEKVVIIEWTGTSSGKNFTGYITEDSLKMGKKISVNCYAICLAKKDGESLKYDEKLVPLFFYNKLEFPL